MNGTWVPERTKAALKAAKARGVALGNPNIQEAGKNGRAASVAAVDRFAEKVWPIIESLREEGLNLSTATEESHRRGAIIALKMAKLSRLRLLLS